MKVFDEPLGESNKERREKYEPVFQKKAPNNIFIIKSQKLTTRGVLIKLMSQNLSKSKFLHESSKLEHFQWGGGKNLRGTNLGGTNFGPLKSLGFQQLSYL